MKETIGPALTGLGVACLIFSFAPNTKAAPTLRMQVDQRGDFALIGNAGGFECAGTEVAPIVGDVACPSSGSADSSPDVFWRSSDPPAVSATADSSISAASARTTAMLNLPPRAVVTYARLYWAGFLASGAAADAQVRIERPGGALDQLVPSDVAHTVSASGGYFWYESTADVTPLVAAAGAGPFRVSDMASAELAQLTSNNDAISAWSLVVFYRLDSDPSRNLALFDGLDLVRSAAPQTVTLSGFTVPSGGFDAKLGVIAYEGEADTSGDALSFNGTALGDAINPVDNFFNSSRSWLGVVRSPSGDLPQRSGAAASMSGFDLDVVDVKALLKPNDTSATILATSTGDNYLLGGFVTSISTYRPDFGASTKVVTDLNGGAVVPNDQLEYVIFVANTGNDGSRDTALSDPLPTGVSYEPGSLRVGLGDGAGLKTDAKDDDQAEYDALTRTITVRLGAGADGVQGGSIAPAAATEVRFRVRVDAKAMGSVLNQAVVTASGKQGAASTVFVTDGNGAVVGNPPTEVVVVGCATNADCDAPTPVCDARSALAHCVQCLADDDCTNPSAPHCDPVSQACDCPDGCNGGSAGAGPGPGGEGGAPAAGAGGAGGTTDVVDAGGTSAGGAQVSGSAGVETGGTNSGDAGAAGTAELTGAPSVDHFGGNGCACRTTPRSASAPAWLGVVLAFIAARARRSQKREV